jgi:hypothetical protein
MVSAATVPCGDAPRGDGRARSDSDGQRAGPGDSGFGTARDAGRESGLDGIFFGAGGLSLVCGLRAACDVAFRCQANELFPPSSVRHALHNQGATHRRSARMGPCLSMASLCCCSAGQGSVIRPGPVAEEKGVRFRAFAGGDGICRERQAEARPPGDGRSEAWRGSRMRARDAGRRGV